MALESKKSSQKLTVPSAPKLLTQWRRNLAGHFLDEESKENRKHGGPERRKYCKNDGSASTERVERTDRVERMDKTERRGTVSAFRTSSSLRKAATKPEPFQLSSSDRCSRHFSRDSLEFAPVDRRSVGTPRRRKTLHRNAQERFDRFLVQITEEGNCTESEAPVVERKSSRLARATVAAPGIAKYDDGEDIKQRIENEKMLIELEKMRIEELKLRAYRKKLEEEVRQRNLNPDDLNEG
mmetsp:Transcript_4565/g.13806  ORF Transcript_4565/g.13806 Transcript_4565/m.13806 type:complete len:239 (-) Transcript_4565:836-1552(-)